MKEKVLLIIKSIFIFILVVFCVSMVKTLKEQDEFINVQNELINTQRKAIRLRDAEISAYEKIIEFDKEEIEILNIQLAAVKDNEIIELWK